MPVFPAKVERWRSQLQAAGSGVPVDFMLAWIDHESGGRPEVVTSIGERGIFQIHPDEAKTIGISDADFQALTSETAPGPRNVEAGLRLIRYRQGQADALLRQVGASWASGSYWTLVKLFHGAPAVAKEGLVAVARYLGHAPQDWAEFYANLPNVVLSNDKAQRLAAKVSGNSNEIAQKAGLSTVGKVAFGMGTAIIIGVLAFFGYRWWKGRA